MPSATIVASPSASASSISSSVSATSCSSLLHALHLRRRAGCARASASARRRHRSRGRGPRPGRSVRRGGLRRHPSQRCLLSSATDCLICSFRASDSADMAHSRCKGAAANTARPGRCRPRRAPACAPAGVAPSPPARRRWRPRRRSGREAPGTWSGLNASVTVPEPVSQLRHRHAGRRLEGQHRPVLQRDRHEVVPDRCRRRAAPVSLSPSEAGLSKPTQTVVTRSGVKPENQASVKSCVVPVLPAIGRPEPRRHRRRRCRAASRPASW